MVRGFRDFLLRGNVVDLAVAVVIGAAFGAVVAAMVKDLLTPLIAAIGGQPDFSSLSFTIHHSVFRYGEFLNAVISFLIIAAVIYFFVVAPFAKLIERFHPKRADAPQKDCPYCLSSIPAAARRCPFCTSELAESELAAVPPA